jgi:hypothetical protein
MQIVIRIAVRAAADLPLIFDAYGAWSSGILMPVERSVDQRRR